MEHCEICGEYTRVNVYGICGPCDLKAELDDCMVHGPEADIFQEID